MSRLERYAWICENHQCNLPHRTFLNVGDPRPKCKSCQKPMSHQVNQLYMGVRPGPHRAEIDARVKAAETTAKAAAVAKLAEEHLSPTPGDPEPY